MELKLEPLPQQDLFAPATDPTLIPKLRIVLSSGPNSGLRLVHSSPYSLQMKDGFQECWLKIEYEDEVCRKQ